MTKRMVNHYYFYCVDDDFGPFFLKLCSYFPYNGRLCINGHEYVKRQLDKRGIAYEALDNGIAWCEDPEALQVICDILDAEKIERLVRKWFKRLPHPFTRETRRPGVLPRPSLFGPLPSTCYDAGGPVFGLDQRPSRVRGGRRSCSSMIGLADI
jgi:hypothetical protein